MAFQRLRIRVGYRDTHSQFRPPRPARSELAAGLRCQSGMHPQTGPCILTGRYSHQTGMIQNNLQLPPSEHCWPEMFRGAGYATHTWASGTLTGQPSLDSSRRAGVGGDSSDSRASIEVTYITSPGGFDDRGAPLADLRMDLPEPYYEPALQTDLAIDFMRRQAGRQFVCFLSWGPPHTPFRPPDAFNTYDPGEINLRPNVPGEHRHRARKELTGYYGLCESLDHGNGPAAGVP